MSVQNHSKKFLNAFPRRLEQQLKDEAKRCHPKEAVGLLVIIDGELVFMPGRNVSAEPEKCSRLHPDDYEAAEERGEIAFHFHSHTNELATPSDGDKTMSEKYSLPLVIIGWPTEDLQFYFPTGWRAPLLGRPYVYGLLDCWTLVQDYHFDKFGLKIIDIERPDDWWSKSMDKRRAEQGLAPLNLYLDNYEKAGFRRVEELLLHNVLLMQVNSDRPNHAAIFVGDGMILHHLSGRVSREQPYVADFGYYACHTVMQMRHESLP